MLLSYGSSKSLVSTKSRNNMSRKLREEVLKLIEEKEKLENEIKELSKILTKNHVGMDDPLVDEEGYPLANVDIYQVRHARHTIIWKQNDHKTIMKKIEEGVSEYYHDVNVQTTDSMFQPQMNITADVPEHTEPFARIHMVNPGSPADAAGIRDGDMLIEFGSVNSKNFRGVNDIATIVLHRMGNKVNLKIKRNAYIKKVAIVPMEWSGQGLLGCHVVPL